MDKTRLVWLVEEINPKTNKPFEVSQIYTLSLHPKAKLCQHLEAWRGKAFTDKEREGFDIEKLLGVPCQLQVIHKIKEDATYANISAILPLAKGQVRLIVPTDYVRRKDRVTSTPSDASEAFHADDSDVPFAWLLPIVLPLIGTGSLLA